MKARLSSLCLALALACLAPSAIALMTYHGREFIRSSGWSDALSAMVNHPARVCGQIGPFGPSSKFHYTGDTKTLNQLLEQYATLPQKSRVLYVQAGSGPAVEGFKDQETHDFDLSIN